MLYRYRVYINVIGPESRQKFVFAKALQFLEPLSDRIVLDDEKSGEKFVIEIIKGASYPTSPDNIFAGEVIAFLPTEDSRRVKQFMDFLRQESWEENKGTASFDK